MSKIQSALAKCVEEVSALLVSLSDPSNACAPQAVERALLSFYRQSWLLPELSDAQNAALVTVSCIPLWELLNLFSGMFTPLSGAAKAVAIGLLTTLYPKSQDRRCFFQQPGVVGTDSANSVPLFTPTPMTTELRTSCEGGTTAFRECVSALRNPVAIQNRILRDRTGVVALVNTFTTIVVPSCCFISAESSRNATAGKCIFQVGAITGGDVLPFKAFAETIWNFLVIAEQLNCTEGKELRKVVSASSWAAQTVAVQGKTISYAALISPILDAVAICITTCSTSNPTTDNKPLVDPSVLRTIMSANPAAPPQESEVDFSSPCALKALPMLSAPVAADVEKQVANQLLSSIPQEIEFFGTSATCRDCDQLTRLCRSLLFSPVRLCDSTGQALSLRISTQLNFDRKRPRGDDDGPALLPVTLSLSDTLGEGEAAPTLLERLCLQWNSAATVAGE